MSGKLRALLQSGSLDFLCEAHNGLSAKVVEEAGFKGIWASGLCLSAQYGVRDNNEASWTQVLEMVEFMADAVEVPILLDGDTGYGNFNNLRRLVNKLEQRGVAGVCIEDKLFPKTNSFIEGESQPLADVEEFCGRIRAGKDAQRSDDFQLVARVEALIAGRGMEEALRRAEAYHEAGADAILIHSKKRSGAEILEFTRHWGGRAPLVIVPTTYFTTPTEVFREAGISLVIWANHLLRAGLGAMQRIAKELQEKESLVSVEGQVVPVKEVFRIQGAGELLGAEQEYLPRSKGMRGIVLAASRGSAFGELTLDRPKAMIPVAGKPLARHMIDALREVGIRKITVVRGFAPASFTFSDVDYVDNEAFESSGEIQSLKVALDDLGDGDGLMIGYGDVIVGSHVLDFLLHEERALAIPVDSAWEPAGQGDEERDLVRCSAEYHRTRILESVSLEGMNPEVPDATGEWMGILYVAEEKVGVLRSLVERLIAVEGGDGLGMPDVIQALLDEGHEVGVDYLPGNWLDIDEVKDLLIAGRFP